MEGKGVIMVIILANAFVDRMIGQGVPPVIDSCAFGSCHHLEGALKCARMIDLFELLNSRAIDRLKHCLQ